MTDKELEEAASGFLEMVFNLGEPAAAVSAHVGGMSVQHNPQVADGAEAFIGFVNSVLSPIPRDASGDKASYNTGQDDSNALHLTLIPGSRGSHWQISSVSKGTRWLSTGTSSRKFLMPQPTRTECSNLGLSDGAAAA